jgi:dTDP-4-dehydrorhamnose reductase
MLGWVVKDYLSQNSDFKVVGAARSAAGEAEFDAEKYLGDSALFQGYEYIINCIGIIKPHCKDNDAHGVQRAINVNARFPWLLNQGAVKANAKVIQIATDCVYSGTKGKYLESDPHDALDVYGKTKSLGEVFESANFLNIRCSIIGPEKKGKLSLLDWFLNQPQGSELKGFSHHLWNGVTTLQFAEICEKVIQKDLFDDIRKVSHTHHFVPNNTVDKFELLNTFSKVFDRKHEIKNVNDVGPKVDRTISTRFNALGEIYGSRSIEQALQDIKSRCNF